MKKKAYHQLPFWLSIAIDEVIYQCNGRYRDLTTRSHYGWKYCLLCSARDDFRRIAILRYDTCCAKSILSTLFWLINFFETNIIPCAEKQHPLPHKSEQVEILFITAMVKSFMKNKIRMKKKSERERAANEIKSLCLSCWRWRWFNFYV